jgi:hypothetical protein
VVPEVVGILKHGVEGVRDLDEPRGPSRDETTARLLTPAAASGCTCTG